MQDLKGKIALVTGIANKRSIAYAIAQDFARYGVRLVIAYQPFGKDSEEQKIKKLTADFRPELLIPLDAASPKSILATIGQIKKKFGRLHVLVHSIAGAKREELAGRFVDTSLEGYLLAQQISAYSLIELTRAARPLMLEEGGSVMTLSYIGSMRVTTNYNVMGSAKAALEANVRYLAHDMGEENIRVNAISPGPVRTLSASGIKDFLFLLHQSRELSALKRNVTTDEIAHTASFLASSLSSGITGQVIFVDGGYNNYG
ncbi:MAG: enoyl-ACP reductase [SAR324 cluster bacterium]|nr:enoyl-ACP reductase [SAR324 cluster bacterium]